MLRALLLIALQLLGEANVFFFIPAARARPGNRMRLDTAAFVAYPVTGGITFTFGGVRVNDCARVMSTSWTAIPGLYACGEMVGGLFHGNYPGGTGLMSDAVFGRLAGAHAAGD